MADFVTTNDPLIDIPELIKWRGDGVTFVELLQHIPYLKGDFGYGVPAANIIYWHGLSEKCIQALTSLIDVGTVRLAATTPLTYYIDGAVPKLPLAKSNRNYKKPHWTPITFCLARKAA
jgi:hypothetical protein